MKDGEPQDVTTCNYCVGTSKIFYRFYKKAGLWQMADEAASRTIDTFRVYLGCVKNCNPMAIVRQLADGYDGIGTEDNSGE